MPNQIRIIRWCIKFHVEDQFQGGFNYHPEQFFWTHRDQQGILSTNTKNAFKGFIVASLIEVINNWVKLSTWVSINQSSRWIKNHFTTFPSWYTACIKKLCNISSTFHLIIYVSLPILHVSVFNILAVQ